MRAYQIDVLIGGKVVCEFYAVLKLVEAELLRTCKDEEVRMHT
jgi:hypothetical protein